MHTIEPIGKIESPYKEKFSVPRQPRLVPSATAKLRLIGNASSREAVRGIEQFSHIWLLFLFDQNISAGWKPTVRPPRLGGNQRIGAFASRSTFRPNAIGMSAVELKGVDFEGNDTFLSLGSTDLVDGTPIVDIKPYLPYSDSIPDALGGYADTPPQTYPVTFTDHALCYLNKQSEAQMKYQVIEQVLAQDPRPAYKKSKIDPKEYAVNLFDLNIKFVVEPTSVTVTAIDPF